MWNIFVYKRNEEEKKEIWHLEIFHIKEFFQIEKKRKYDVMSEIYSFEFSKIFFCSKIKSTK